MLVPTSLNNKTKGKTMPEMTKEQLEQIIDAKTKAAVDASDASTKDFIKGLFEEQKQEMLKNVGDFKKPGNDPVENLSGYKSLGEFAVDIYKAGEGFAAATPKLKGWLEKATNIEKTSQAAGVPNLGGALIPPEFQASLQARMRERASLVSKCTVIPMSSLTVTLPDLADYDNSQGKVGGNIKFRTVAEMAQATENNFLIGDITLALKEYNALIKVSRQLIQFSPISVEGLIMGQIGDAQDLALTNHFINGTGGGVPLGVINSPALISVAKETGQKADTLLYENILEMEKRAWRSRGEYYGSADIIRQLGVMSITVGTGGSAVFVPNGTSAAAALAKNLMGRNLTFLEECPTLGDLGDLILVDWSQYFVGQFAGAPGIQAESSIHLNFDYRKECFQFTFYADGQPAWKDVHQPLKGTSKSPYVAIAARA